MPASKHTACLVGLLTGGAVVPAVAHAFHIRVAVQVLKGVLQEDDIHVCKGEGRGMKGGLRKNG